METDDNQVFIAVTAQPKEKGKGPEVYHAIETPEDNSILGRYFRERIGARIGEKLLGQPVQIEHLMLYGRTSVEFTKLGEDLFFMDFSV